MKKCLILSMVSVLSLGLLAAGAQFLLAQERPGGGRERPGGLTGGFRGGTALEAVMELTPNGMFVLRNGVLAKYEAATLKEKGVFSLFGPMPAVPQGDMAQNREAWTAYTTELARRAAPPVMIVTDTDLLIVIGDGFARINQTNLKVESHGSLAPADGEPAAAARQNEKPTCKLVGNTLYILRSAEVLSLNIADGTILGRSALPKDMQPPTVNPWSGGRPGGGARE